MTSTDNASPIINWIEENRDRFINMAETIWQTPEVAWHEFKSSRLQADFLAAEDFLIAWNVGGLNTAFVAEWGNEGPVLAFIGEYDALPGLSQSKESFQDTLIKNGAGHGCGHNLLGTGALAAAVAVQKWLQKTGMPGIVRYYGCPAEEEGGGKVFMARAGAFDDIDAAFNFHPDVINMPNKGSTLGISAIQYRFHGRAAHASIAPHEGRSALDAVELMNVGVNYLREHIKSDVRIHYVITNGGQAPNIVPDEAEALYYIRAAEKDYLAEVVGRIRKVAEGAAMMTETTLEVRFQDGFSPVLSNHYLADLQYQSMQKVGALEFTPEEIAYAQKVNDAFGGTNAAYFTQRTTAFSIPAKENNSLERWKSHPLISENFPAMDAGVVSPGSTDVGDLSQIVPISMLVTTCWPTGVPGHSWGNVAASGMSIGHKGMLHAAKIMAITAAEIYTNPEHLVNIKAEFEQMTDGKPYAAPIPDSLLPPQYDPLDD
ncbi:MAG: amidohydrolase [Chloroflexi bacterium]|nr:amidohydrolase [Chloroflexota bacterium]